MVTVPTATPPRDIVSWDEMDRLVAGLAERLVGEEFDLLLAITRGGLVPAGMLAYRLRIRNILVAAVEYYDERRPARPASDVPPVPGRSAPARPAGARRRRGLGQRDDDPRGDRARSARPAAIPTTVVLHYKPSHSVGPGRARPPCR